MELKYKGWGDVSITLNKKIKEVYEDDALEDLDKEVCVLALLCDVEPDCIWNLSIYEIDLLRQELSKFGNTDFKKNLEKLNGYKVGDIECEVCTDLNKFSYAQYVDFQGYFTQDDNIGKLLSTMLIPKGKKYNDGYDMVEFIKTIENNINILKANELCFFFLKKLVNSMKRMNRSLLGWMTMKKMITKKKNPMYQKLQKGIEMSKEIEHLLTLA